MQIEHRLLSVALVLVAACGENTRDVALPTRLPPTPSVPAQAPAAEPTQEASPPGQVTLSFVYSDLSNDYENATAVTLRVESPTRPPTELALGRFDGSCSSHRYAEFGRESPSPNPVMGTVCYMGGSSTIAITRAGAELIASTQDQGDGVEIDPRTGRESAQRATPWRELGRIALPASASVLVADAR